jgi:hypothetical protein
MRGSTRGAAFSGCMKGRRSRSAGLAQLRRARLPPPVACLVSAWIPAVVIGVEQWYSVGTFWVATGVGVVLLIGVPTFLITRVPR